MTPETLANPTQHLSDIEKYLLLTEDKISKMSKDRSTKVGALILDPSGISPLGYGYNGFVRGINDFDEKRHARPEKYFWGEHAERNALYNIAHQTLHGSLAICTNFPSMEAARALICSGIKYIVVDSSRFRVQDQQALHERFKNIYSDVCTPQQMPTLNGVKERVLQMLGESLVQWIDLATCSDHPIQTTHYKISKRKLLENYEVIYGHKELFSTDPTIKAGCLLINPVNGAPYSWGASGLPNGYEKDLQMALKNQVGSQTPQLFFSEHPDYLMEAEKNAIFNVIRPKILGSTLIASVCPCTNCAIAIYASGVKHVATRKPDPSIEMEQRWAKQFERSIGFISQLGIDVQQIVMQKNKALSRNDETEDLQRLSDPSSPNIEANNTKLLANTQLNNTQPNQDSPTTTNLKKNRRIR